MASGSSGRANHSGSKAFDFGSDDILCSYEDYGSQDGNNGIHADGKEFNKSRVARSPVFPAASYGTPEESSYNEGVISTVDNTMKKYTDNLMRFLEGISSRLSQLELYCYNLDKSIGEMRSDLSRDHGESESKLKSLEKHVQEVHRSVQILRDKQELADTHKELAKLQLEHKDTSSGGNNQQQNEERSSSAPSSEAKKGSENPSDGHDQQQQLALALPHQAPPHQPSMAPPQNMAPGYYLPQMNSNNIPAPSQTPPQYLQGPSQAQNPQINQHVVSPYQQQWQAQPPSHQQQVRTSSQMGAPFSYPNSEMAPKPSFVGASQPGSEGMHYGYSAVGNRPIQQPQHLKPSNGATGYGPQPGDGYALSGPRPALPPGNSNAYMVFDSEGGRTAHHHHFQQQNAYPPPSGSIPPQRMQTNANNPNINNMGVPPPPQSSMRSHPYNELIDKLVSMGYRVDHVIAIIQRLDESGQPIDFNSVLDMLNGHSHGGGGGGSQRGGWSA